MDVAAGDLDAVGDIAARLSTALNPGRNKPRP
jgi:hypothetical protein